MTPTICTENEKRCRHTVREIKPENPTSSFSVINYVGKKSTKLKNYQNNSKLINKKKLELLFITTESKATNDEINSSDTSNNNISNKTSEELQSSLYLSDSNDRIPDNRINSNCNSLSSDSDIEMNDNSLGDELRPISNSSATSGDNNHEGDVGGENGCRIDLNQHKNGVCNQLSSLMNFRYSVKLTNKSDVLFDKNNYYEKTKPVNSNHYHRQSNNNNNSNGGLLEIAIRTVHLMKRNKLLQEKLAQLQAETQAFIASVMANPENKEIREQIQNKKL